MAVLELSAIAAKTFVFADQAKYQAGRIESLRDRLARHEPKFAVFYGTEYSLEYQQIAGGVFNEAGFYQSGKTLNTGEGAGGHPRASNGAFPRLGTGAASDRGDSARRAARERDFARCRARAAW